MKFSNKKALELAANTIVMLIVAVIIFTLAMGLTYNVFCEAQDYAADLDGQSDQEIERLLAQGGQVEVANNIKSPQPPSGLLCTRQATAAATFTLGIKNTQDYPVNFSIEVQNESGDKYALAEYFENGTIPARESYTGLIIVPVEDITQSYVFQAQVRLTNESTYDVIRYQLLYVEP